MSTIEQQFEEFKKKEGIPMGIKETAPESKPLGFEEFERKFRAEGRKAMKEKERTIKIKIPLAPDVIRSLLRLDTLREIKLNSECKRKFGEFLSTGRRGGIPLSFELVLRKDSSVESFLEKLGDTGKKVEIVD